MKIIKGGVASAKGFESNALSCGIKNSGNPDLGLIYSVVPAVTACVFTRNSIKAAPVIVTQKHVRNHQAQAIVVNSGNANCYTGDIGLTHARQTAELFGGLLNIPEQNVIVASTGIIGKRLPYKKIQTAAKKLVEGLSAKGSLKTAQAILTTDLKTKQTVVQTIIGGQKVTVGACAKGSGMIEPNMATMLVFVNTDAMVSPKMLKLALKIAVDQSFHCITVDGCMSTNDMVSVMANGLAEHKTIVKPGKDFDCFCEALNYVCLDLAKKIVLDGEGATKFIEINVHRAKTHAQAKTIGKQIANSVLVKTAAFGSNPNWGRVGAAVGALGIKAINEKNLKITFSSFKKKHIKIRVNCGIGRASVNVYASDLSYDYVKINAEYN